MPAPKKGEADQLRGKKGRGEGDRFGQKGRSNLNKISKNLTIFTSSHVVVLSYPVHESKRR